MLEEDGEGRDGRTRDVWEEGTWGKCRKDTAPRKGHKREETWGMGDCLLQRKQKAGVKNCLLQNQGDAGLYHLWLPYLTPRGIWVRRKTGEEGEAQRRCEDGGFSQRMYIPIAMSPSHAHAQQPQGTSQHFRDCQNIGLRFKLWLVQVTLGTSRAFQCLVSGNIKRRAETKWSVKSLLIWDLMGSE